MKRLYEDDDWRGLIAGNVAKLREILARLETTRNIISSLLLRDFLYQLKTGHTTIELYYGKENRKRLMCLSQEIDACLLSVNKPTCRTSKRRPSGDALKSSGCSILRM